MNQLLSRGNVVELQGAPGTGKTRLVYDAVATCILPKQASGLQLGGWGQAAFVLDTEDTFDIQCVHRLLCARLDRAFRTDDTVQLKDDLDQARATTVEEALRNLHVFRPASSTQLAATILQLPYYHHEEPYIQNCEFGLLVVDSMSSFYWQDRFTTEQLRGGPSEARTPFRHVLTAIERIKTSHRPTILLTNWGLNPLVKDPALADTSPFFRQHLYPTPAGFELSAPHQPAHEFGSRATMGEYSRRATPAHIAPEYEPIEAPARSLATLPLTHHITLSRSPIMDPNEDFDTLQDKDTVVKSFEFVGRVRVPHDKTIAEFRFSVHEDRIDFEPNDMFRR